MRGGGKQERVYCSYLESPQAPLIWHYVIISHFIHAKSPDLMVKTMQANSLGLWWLLITLKPRPETQEPSMSQSLLVVFRDNHKISKTIKMMFCFFV